jgi:hypothetical protein
MALSRIAFDAHHRDGMIQIQKAVQVPSEKRTHDALIVPIPNRIPSATLSRLSSNIAWYTPLFQVEVLETGVLQYLLKIRLA